MGRVTYEIDSLFFEQGERWVTAYGRVVKVRDMDKAHAYNAMKLIERNGGKGTPLWKALRNRAAFMGLAEIQEHNRKFFMKEEAR